MVKFFFMLLGIALTLTTHAQQITGRVTDQLTGEGIPGATIELAGGRSLITNEKGYFEIPSAPPNKFARISFVGYKPLEIHLQTGAPNEFRLERWELFMEPVEVRATRADDNAPFTKTNITKKNIEENNLGADLPFLINQTPSVIVNSDAGNGVGYTGIRIRGSDATRINMTINGIPYNDAESQGLFFVNLPDISSSLNSIQVQRGVGTSSNGAGAFGATMNLSTNEVNTEAYAELNNSIGSFNTLKHTVKAGSGLLGDHFTLDARASKISSDGYIERASSDLKSLYLSGAYLAKKTTLRFNVLTGKEKTYQAWYGVSEADLENNRRVNYAGMEKPGSPYDNETDNYQQDHYQFFLNHQFNPALSFNTAVFLTEGKGYYEQYKADEAYADYGLPDYTLNGETLPETDLVRQLWLDNQFYGQVFSIRYKNEADQVDLGGGWNKYEGNHFGKIIWAEQGIDMNHEWYHHPADKTDLNAYAKYQRRIAENFFMTGDIQFRRVRYRIFGFRDNPDVQPDNTFNFFNPKIGASYMRGRNQFYISYSKGSKEPNRDDFEAGGENQPKPEHLHDIEMGWEFRAPKHRLAATLYYMKYRDQLVQTGKINDVGAYARTNIPKSFRAGIELEASAKLHEKLSVSGNIAFSRNRIEEFVEYFDDYDNGGQKSIHHGSTDISFSPSIVGFASIDFQPVKGLMISAPMKYISRQYLDNTSNKERSLDAYFLQDLRLSYTVRNLLVREAGIIFQLNNVFNRKYEANGYTYSYQYGGSVTTENFYYPMAGINFMAGLNISL